MGYQVVDAGEGFRFPGTCKDTTGTVIPKASVSAITVTATDSATGSVVNSRNAQNCLDANDGAMDTTSGAFVFSGQPEDTTPLDADADSSEHRFHFRVIGTFPGEVLEFDHYVRCVNTLLLCRFDQVKQHLAEVDDDQEPLILNLIESFTRLVENITGRSLQRKTATEVVDAQPGSYTVRVSRWPIWSITSLKEDRSSDFTGDALDASSYTIGPEGIIRKKWVAFAGGAKSVQVVGDMGLARTAGAAPADLRDVAAQHVAHAWMNRSTVDQVKLNDYAKKVISLYAPRLI